MTIAVDSAIALRSLEPNVLCGLGKVTNGFGSTRNSVSELEQVHVLFQGGADSFVLIHYLLYRRRIGGFPFECDDSTAGLQVIDYPRDAGVPRSQRAYESLECINAIGEVRNFDAPAEFECESIFHHFRALSRAHDRSALNVCVRYTTPMDSDLFIRQEAKQAYHGLKGARLKRRR